jgi:hypothetical protein
MPSLELFLFGFFLGGSFMLAIGYLIWYNITKAADTIYKEKVKDNYDTSTPTKGYLNYDPRTGDIWLNKTQHRAVKIK